MVPRNTTTGAVFEQMAARARPFLKWAGGKRTLIPDIAKLAPGTISQYWEPFVGGGAVFFSLDSRITIAHLSDINAELALVYHVVSTRTEELIAALQHHQSKHANKRYYYQVRKQTKHEDAVDVAARFIYLNKTCFNGLYRVNKSGAFNVPRGSYTNPVICDADNLRAASQILKKTTIKFGDFERVTPGLNDFVYCDPPYDGTFDGYDKSRFGDAEQRRLRDAALRWHKIGANVMISNADTELIRTLYGNEPFHIYEVRAPRTINCKPSERGAVGELLVTTYDQ